MHNAGILFRKQAADLLRNKVVLIQFVLMPLMAVVMQTMVPLPELPRNYFIYMFAVMFVGMAPVVSMSAVVSEEREKHTLAFLYTCGARPAEYLLGSGLCLWCAFLIGSAVMCAAADLTAAGRLAFLGVMGAGLAVSLVLGAAVGAGCDSQQKATAVALPVSMAFAFVPMIAMFNENVESAARILYTEQISLLLEDAAGSTAEAWTVIAVNAALFSAIFYIAFRRNLRAR